MFSPRISTSMNASSMADIAFLMLCFFMMTTTIQENKGLILLLPQLETPHAPVKDRNVFNIRLNSADQLMVQHEIRESTNGLRAELKSFILNNGLEKNLSENPEKAIISLKADRGSSYLVYISLLDDIQAAYYEIYGAQIGFSAEAYRKLDIRNPYQKQLYDKGRAGIPMNISITEL